MPSVGIVVEFLLECRDCDWTHTARDPIEIKDLIDNHILEHV